ncbi:hypothetical protein E2562_015141 [Oryza meyeriana var. granulata]|uniref:Uncharacterized protein n=1 Tax=Oryza meyeriana var. granulata TaxID=110450 RepID=A0A6G1DX49_9ORYZ|nr:hypothetical protein E2562_015141 [Oryza meyeriana var. granulata]
MALPKSFELRTPLSIPSSAARQIPSPVSSSVDFPCAYRLSGLSPPFSPRIFGLSSPAAAPPSIVGDLEILDVIREQLINDDMEEVA